MKHTINIATAGFNLLVEAASKDPSLVVLVNDIRRQIEVKPYFFGSVPEDESDLRDFEEGRDDDRDDEPRDDMDGDFDSAMASAGHGTDEDYGYFGEMGCNED